MFYKDQNFLKIKNVGLLLSVIILLILLLANLDKCYAPLSQLFSFNTNTEQKNTINNSIVESVNNKEGFNDAMVTVSANNINVEIIPEKKSVNVKFEKVQGSVSVKGYLLVLAKYDKNLIKKDHMDVKITNEIDYSQYVKKSALPNSQKPPTTTPNNLDSICNEDGICEYTFTDVEPKDENGDLYYYRLGVGVITDTDTNDITAYKFGSAGNKQEYFRLDITKGEQIKLLKRLNEIEKGGLLKPKQDSVQELKKEDEEDKYDVDAYMKMLKPYIGNYPDEFTLNKQQVGELSLNNYMGESLDLGELNVNVDIADLMPSNPVEGST